MEDLLLAQYQTAMPAVAAMLAPAATSKNRRLEKTERADLSWRGSCEIAALANGGEPLEEENDVEGGASVVVTVTVAVLVSVDIDSSTGTEAESVFVVVDEDELLVGGLLLVVEVTEPVHKVTSAQGLSSTSTAVRTEEAPGSMSVTVKLPVEVFAPAGQARNRPLVNMYPATGSIAT